MFEGPARNKNATLFPAEVSCAGTEEHLHECSSRFLPSDSCTHAAALSCGISSSKTYTDAYYIYVKTSTVVCCLF